MPHRRLEDAPLGGERRDEAGGRDVEGRVEPPGLLRRGPSPREDRDLLAGAFLDLDARAVRHREVDRRPRRRDEQGDPRLATGQPHPERPHLVRDVAVRGDAVGADDGAVHEAAQDGRRGGPVDLDRVRDALTGQLVGGEPRPLADVVGGILVAKEEGILAKLRRMMIDLGCNMDPHQAFLVLRGLKTLGVRVERAQANAAKIATWLEKHPKVVEVRYIGLPSHPQHELARRQMSGFGSMIAFELEGGYEAGRTLMDHVKLATLAVSLGGVETLIEHPASMTHAGMSRAAREEAGFTDGLVRYAVGIEDAADLIADLEQALAAIEDATADGVPVEMTR